MKTVTVRLNAQPSQVRMWDTYRFAAGKTGIVVNKVTVGSDTTYTFKYWNPSKYKIIAFFQFQWLKIKYTIKNKFASLKKWCNFTTKKLLR